ncbi:hypothetical protein ABPG72_014232 [Tetrahymena utriculariae]
MINEKDYIQESKINIKLDGINHFSFFGISKKMDSTFMIDEFSESQEQNLRHQNEQIVDISDNQNEEMQNESSSSKENDSSKAQNNYEDNDDENDEKHNVDDQLKNNFNLFEAFIKNHKKNSDIQIKQPNQQFQYKKCNTVNTPQNISKKQVATASSYKSRISQNQYSQGSYLSARRRFNSQFLTLEKVVRMLTLIKPQILKFLQNHTMFGKYRLLDSQSRFLISDKSDYNLSDREFKSNCFQKLTQVLTSIYYGIEKGFFLILNRIPLFNPENKFRIFINAIIVSYNCFFLLLISFTIFFQADFGHLQHVFNYIAIVAWVTEMLIQMNTATYYEGDFITDRKQLFKIYLKEYFFFEILPLIFEGKTSENQIINILYQLPLLLKIKGMSIILVKLEFLILQHLKKHYLLQIFKLLIQLLLLTHLMACSYSLLANFETNILDIQQTWISTSKIIANHSDWWSIYIEAQLWAFHTMGNSFSISVISQYEYSFTSFWMLVSCVLYAYLVNTLGNIIQNINSNSENYKKDLNILNKYMQRKKIDLELQRIMNIHLSNQYEQQQNFQFDLEQETLNKLSYHMKNKLVTQSNKNIVKQLKFLEGFSQNTLSNIYQIMQEELYSEGQIINTFDSVTLDSCAYLITQGKVEILQEFQFDENNEDLTIQYQNDYKKKTIDQSNEGKKVVKVLQAGEYFGECEFFINNSLPYTVRSQKHTTVVKIHTSKFIEIVKKNKQDYQKFQEIKHRIQLNKEVHSISTKCLICSSYYHHFIDCSVTHYFKRSRLLLFKYIHSPPQQRNNTFIRKREKEQHFFDNASSTFQISINENDEDNSFIENDLSQDFDESMQLSQSTKPISQKYINKNRTIDTEIIQEEENEDELFKQNISDKSSLENINQINRSNVRKEQNYIKSNTIGCALKNNTQSNKLIKQRQSLRQSLLHRTQSIDKKEQYEKPVYKEKILKQCSINNFQEQGQQVLSAQKTQNKYSVFDLLKKQIHSSSQQIDTNYSENEENQIPSIQEIFQKMSTPSLSQRNSLQQILKQYPLLNQQYQINSYTYGFETLQKMKWDSTIYYWEFDKKCEFLYFFPHHNFKHVFKKIMKKYFSIKDKKRLGFRKSIQMIANINSIK